MFNLNNVKKLVTIDFSDSAALDCTVFMMSCVYVENKKVETPFEYSAVQDNITFSYDLKNGNIIGAP